MNWFKQTMFLCVWVVVWTIASIAFFGATAKAIDLIDNCDALEGNANGLSCVDDGVDVRRGGIPECT
jgi:hypothetical protein